MSARPDRTPLPRSFFDRPVLTVAPDLLGRTLVRRTPDGLLELRITEVEAYEGEADPGSHAYRGRTPRNASMFGPPGHAYVYFIYGMWFSLNVVCGPPGHASGVLLRSGEVTVGADLARKRRLSARVDRELAKGPARLAAAMDIDRSLDGTDLCGGPDSPLSLLTGTPTPSDLVSNGPRTGISGAGAAHPYRYWLTDDPTVSPYRAHAPRRRST
ncbi:MULTISPECIES: DNA-3-methyladenine glycosylase [unclassified Streptomyces]|uniref:DNA-3-methyladenine glycosylase n=1 Tax=unclassified Streptomyces TaxID=2593676 RepID=UPI001BEBC127|nr:MULTISPECIES: DNA-3-methyladenine glycosylase [unclassified Streptomyces]MBT2406316.1 DNA-3-methyladenine glycosylase [Streptomyces sp. ISL-21]MBT2612972.1 DNA-3-methyladenine glycosylase [Streptomyces sp. ISL-87]